MLTTNTKESVFQVSDLNQINLVLAMKYDCCQQFPLSVCQFLMFVFVSVETHDFLQ